jgi:four helix bundle protein
MRSPAKSFQDLLVWEKAHQFILSTYGLCKKLPDSEIYGLTFQLRRSAVSISANIAEGFRKPGKLDKVRFLIIAQGFWNNRAFILILAQELGYCNFYQQFEQLAEVSNMLGAYSKSILTPDS